MPKIRTIIETVKSIEENLSSIEAVVHNSNMEANPLLIKILDRIVDINCELDRLYTVTLSTGEETKIHDEHQYDQDTDTHSVEYYFEDECGIKRYLKMED